MSVGSGFKGVVSQPIEESRKNGFLGLLKGTAQGVTGLVVKPISGTLDFLSLTTEGIKNTSKADEDLMQDKRLRLPRPFYESERIIRNYDEFHAFWLNLVPRLSRDMINTDFFYEACLMECTDHSWTVLFLTQSHLALIAAEQSANKKQQNGVYVKWVYETKTIRYVDVVEDNCVNIGFEDSNLNLPLGDGFLADRVKQKIEKIMKNYK